MGKPNEDKFVIEEEDGTTSPGAEESKAWGQKDEDDVPRLKPKYGLPGEEGFENVWGEVAEHPHGEPKENP